MGLRSIEKRAEMAWDYVFERLYCEKTGLFYDVLTGKGEDGAIRHLPTPEEIRLNLPNPCGWNTGMEDGGIHAGMLLETLCERYDATRDASLSKEAKMILKGLRTLCTVSGIRGFLARDVSPEDGKSFYMDSSRDQYTHVIYGIYRYLRCPLCTKDEDAELRDYLVSFAEYAEKCVTKENGYCLLRTDGKPGIVSTMYGKKIDPHEWLRLPMFYLAAYDASGDRHWLNLYRQYRDECLDESYKLADGKYWNYTFGIDQMQISTRLCYELETDAPYKERYLKLLKLTAAFTEGVTEKLLDEMQRDDLHFTTPCREWRKRLLVYNKLLAGHLPLNGFAYNVPAPDPDFKRDLRLPHDIVNVPHLLILAEESVPDQAIDATAELFERMDFENHASASPVYMIRTYWQMMAHNKK